MMLLQQDGHLKDVDVPIVFQVCIYIINFISNVYIYLFKNITEIYRTNVGFWNYAIEPLLQHSRASGTCTHK
jgi:hypothetical protein